MGKLNRNLSFDAEFTDECEKFHIRANGSRPKRRWYLIVCEGIKTEPNYFNQFRNNLWGGAGDKIVVVGAGDNTDNLVKRAKKEVFSRSKSSDPPFYHVWVVFDRDSFPPDDFDNAIHMIDEEDKSFDPEDGQKPHWHAAWSNEAFELWYLYHYQEVQGGGLSRDMFKGMLSSHMCREYKKNDPEMFKRLLPRTLDAIDRARRGAAKWSEETPFHERNPTTMVYELVTELLRYM